MTQSQTPRPPWVEFEGADPAWSGWRQGRSEVWLLQVWLPMWRGLSSAARERYLQTWPPPDCDWREQVERWAE